MILALTTIEMPEFENSRKLRSKCNIGKSIHKYCDPSDKIIYVKETSYKFFYKKDTFVTSFKNLLL